MHDLNEPITKARINRLIQDFLHASVDKSLTLSDAGWEQIAVTIGELTKLEEHLK